MGTITKALSLLELFSEETTNISLAEFVEITKRDKATLYRHLNELEENGFIERNELTRAYRLGPAITRLARIRDTSYPIKAIVKPLLVDLANRLGELVHFSIHHEKGIKTLVLFDPGVKATRINFNDKERESLPLHATASGIAILAFGDPSIKETLFSRELKRFTEHTPVSKEELETLLANTQKTGISQNIQTFDYEAISHGCPVFGKDGQAIGAISVAIPAIRFRAEMTKQISQELFQITKEITHALGAEIPEPYRELWNSGC